MEKKPIRSFLDLDVYQNTFKAALIIEKEVLSKLPEDEKYLLKDHGRIIINNNDSRYTIYD